ncbi:uncharacterized protein LOC119190437 [Manduca sexta]|uniref:uncharacterized protein LOC119190437 n=1 Tax=Manduca sexta TaxID=7130 RepID=UPI00188FDFFE|nr:uncharacterized protein LOC119190437 [Manduca sexta]
MAVKGYQRVSYDLLRGGLLAGFPPWDLEAKTLASLYLWYEMLLARGFRPAPQEVANEKTRLQQFLEAEWEQSLEHFSFGTVTIEAIRPIFAEWLWRQQGSLTFRTTQILSGKDASGSTCVESYTGTSRRYFGAGCRRIRRQPAPGYHHCECEEDSALHTLAVCRAWDSLRQNLLTTVGGNLSLTTVVAAMVENEDGWNSVATFCEQVTSAKEAAVRESERSIGLPFRSRRRRDDLRPP